MVDGVTFVRSDEQTMLADTLAELLGASTDMDRTRQLSLTLDAHDQDVWAALSQMGLVGLALPGEFGGAETTFTDVAIVFEELGRFVVAVPLLSTVSASVAILAAGTEGQHAALLPPIAAGTAIATLAVYEDPHGGVDAPSTSAARIDGGWRISGRKRFVTDAPNADLFVVSAVTDDGVRLFAVDAEREGVVVEPVAALDATRPLADVTFDVIVGEDAALSGANGVAALHHALDVAVVMLAAEQVGVAQRCLEISVEYAKERYQFGRAIGSFQAIKHRCADMLIAVEHARSVAWYAAATLDDPSEAAIAVPLAKSVCSDAAIKVAGDTIQVLGGIGFTWEHDAHLYFKRAKSSSLLFGTVEVHRDRLADAIGV